MPTTTPFNNLITFSRGSNATLTGSNGLIQWAPNNLLTFSEQFDNSAWVKTAVIATANSTVAPNSTTTADTITASAGAGYHYTAQNAAVVAGTTYTASMYVRAGTARYIGFGDAGDAVWHSAYLDTTDGSILNQVNCVATAVSVGGGWFLVTSTFTRTNAANAQIYVGGSTVTGSAGPLFTAVGTETCIAWGAQLELGSTATTYNPTTVKNLLGFSEAFDNAAWTKTRASIVTGAAANPVNGLFNAQKLMEDTTASNTHRVFGATTTTAAPFTLSSYIKAAGRTWVYLRLDRSGGTVPRAWFNLADGTVGTVETGLTANIQSVGSGWYRCSVTVDTAAAGASNPLIGLSTANGTDSYTGDGNSGVYIYGAQLSDSASLDPYVPTPGAAPSSTAFYGPRFDFDPVTLQPRGLLVEEQRTNLLTYSEQVDNAAWVKTNVTVAANAASSPDGALSADAITPTAILNQHRVDVGTSIAAGTYTLSIFAKPNGYGFMWMRLGALNAIFNLSTGAVTGLSGGVTASAVAYPNGWYRCIMTAAAVGNDVMRFNAQPTASAADFVGDGTSSILIWGAQLEAGAFATSYIPTVASTVTRSADVATITGQNFAQWYRQDAGSFVIEFQTLQTGVLVGTSYIIGLDNSASKRIIYIGNGSDSAATFDGATVIGATGDATGSVAKTASVYTASERAIVLNGGAVSTGAVVAGYSTATLLNVGQVSSVSSLNGHIRNIRFIPARAADFQLQGLST